MEANTGTKKTVLLVDDDEVIIRLYQKKLQDAGFHVEIASDGLAALKILPHASPDAVVLDLMMPKFTGADVLKFIRSNPTLKHTKVVIFSNAYMTDLAQSAEKIGVDESLLKSRCTPAHLVGVINELLGIPNPTPTPPT
jgi:chemosensory pili system protein ChpA (sensor histidine kinase/response regulator)